MNPFNCPSPDKFQNKCSFITQSPLIFCNLPLYHWALLSQKSLRNKRSPKTALKCSKLNLNSNPNNSKFLPNRFFFLPTHILSSKKNSLLKFISKNKLLDNHKRSRNTKDFQLNRLKQFRVIKIKTNLIHFSIRSFKTKSQLATRCKLSISEKSTLFSHFRYKNLGNSWESTKHKQI